MDKGWTFMNINYCCVEINKVNLMHINVLFQNDQHNGEKSCIKLSTRQLIKLCIYWKIKPQNKRWYEHANGHHHAPRMVRTFNVPNIPWTQKIKQRRTSTKTLLIRWLKLYIYIYIYIYISSLMIYKWKTILGQPIHTTTEKNQPTFWIIN